LQFVEAKTCDVEILGLPGHCQQLEDTHTLPNLIGTDTPRLAVEAKFFKAFIPEASNHPLSVEGLAESVN
jgi:hypothetical protein